MNDIMGEKSKKLRELAQKLNIPESRELAEALAEFMDNTILVSSKTKERLKQYGSNDMEFEDRINHVLDELEK